MAMAVTTSTTPAREPTTRSTPAASTGKAPEHAAPTGGPNTTSDMLQTVSQMIYTGSYALGYGVVYAAVFVARSLPQDNPVMHGFRDGGAAAMDEFS